MRISVSHQGVLRGRLLAVLDADQDAGRRELDLRGRGGTVRSSQQITGSASSAASSQGLRKASAPSSWRASSVAASRRLAACQR